MARHILAGAVAIALLATPGLAAGRPDWSGRWVGKLENFPGRPGAPAVTVVRDIDGWPEKPGECRTWRTRYSEAGVEKGVKDYRLCLGEGDRLYVDEGGGVTLDGKLLGDVFVSPFKYDQILLVALTRVTGDTMVEEIFTAQDVPAVKGPLSLQARSVQRLTLQRAPRR